MPWVAAALCLACALPLRAEGPAHLTLDVDEVLRRFESAQEATRTLEAVFSQTKASELLGEPQLSEGRIFYAKPDKFLWSYEVPNETRMVIHGNTMLTWYKDLGKASRVDITRKRHRIFQYFAIGEGASALKERFLVQIRPPAEGDREGSIHLELTPRKKRVRTRLQKMELWLDGDLYMPVRIRYEEGNGDFTDFVFSELQPDVEIPESRFSLDLPEDVQVSDTFSQPEPGGTSTE
jgi:outer membrane lipoprotein carrier protein